MSQDVQGMLIQIEATTAQLRRELASADQVVARTTQQIDRNLSDVDSAFDRTAAGAQQAGQLIRGAFAAIAGAGLVGSVIKEADAYGQMADRMRAATADAGEYNLVQQRLLTTAQETYRPLQEAQELYIRSADAIKALGFDTQQTLDITDSFSYLLVTNAASADKAGGALDAYAKALQTGKVDADGWVGIMTAMPTVTDAVAAATGKSAQEVRRLGAEGKLALDDLNQGLLQTLEANRAAAADMSVSVGDALVNIGNAVQVYLGQANESTGATEGLAAVLGVVADNVEIVAAAVGGVAAGAMAVYARSAVVATAETAKGIKAAIADRAARVAQADAVLQAAIADQRKAQTAVILAAREAEAARGTAVQTQMSIQLAQARQREAAATTAVTAAQAGLKTASTGLLSLLGGPMGIALLAGTAAASFLLMGDNAEEAASKLPELSAGLDAAREAFLKLGKAEQQLELTRLGKKIEDEKDRATVALNELRETFANSLYGGSGNRAPSPDAEAALGRLGQAMAAAQQGAAVDWLAIADSMRGVNGISESLVEKTLAVAAGQETSARTTGELQARQAELRAALEATTTAQVANNVATDQASAAGDKYIGELQKRLNTMADKTALEAANRFISENKDLTAAQIEKIRELAAAQDAQREADARATENRKTSTKGVKDHAAAVDALRDKYDPATKALADYQKGIELADAALLDGSYTTEQYQAVVQGLYAELNKPTWDKYNKEAEETAKTLKKLEDETQAIIDRLDPAGKAARDYAAEQKRLNQALVEFPERAEEIRDALGKLGEEYEANQRELTAWGRLTDAAVERVDEAFANAWKNIDQGFDGFADGLKDGFKQLLAELAHEAITKPIVISFANQLLGTSKPGGISDVWGSLFGGASGSGSAGGVNYGQMLQYGQTAYSALTGWGPAAYAGWQTGGVSGAVSGVGNFYGGMVGSAANTVGGWFGGNAAATVGSNAVQGGAGWMLDGAGNLVNTATQTGANAVGSGFGGAGASAINPAMWAIAAILGSKSFYEAGYTLDRNQVANQKLSKISFAIDPALSAVAYSMLQATEVAEKILSPIVGEKWGNILSLGPLLSGVTNTVSKALFGGAWETKDGGIALGAENGDLSAQKYIYQKKKGGLFSSSKKRTRYSELDAETVAGLQDVFDSTEATVSEIYEALGLAVDEGSLAGLQLAREQISTKGKTEEEISAALNEWFGKAAEAMNTELNKVFATGLDYDLAGMQAFVANMQGVNALFDQLNLSLYDSTVAGGKMAEQLSAVAGGFDVLAANTATYYEGFYSAEEKTANTLEAITKAFADADVELAGSREDYRAMVESIDRTTEAGREMFATMMALSDEAAAYVAILDQQAAAAAQALGVAVDGAYASLQRSIAAQQKDLQADYNARAAALNATAAAATANISALTGVSNSLSAALTRLRGTSSDAVRMLRAQSLATLQGALATARAGGSLAGVEGLQDALDVSASMDESLYASLEDFEREQGRTANLIAELEHLNGQQLSAEQQLLDTTKLQLEQAQQQFEQQMEGLNAQLAFAQSQIDALNGVDNSVKSVAEAINEMNLAVVAALAAMGGDTGKNATPANVGTLAESVYQTVLGRNADAGGLAYWQGQVASGAIRLDQLEQAIRNAAVANGEIPAFATGGMHLGGARIVGEFGPELEVTGPARIYNANQTAAMLSGGGSDAAAEEVRALRGEVRFLSQALSAIQYATEETRKALRTQNEVGVPTWSG